MMDGSNLSCGSALTLKKAKNPISVARAVMESTEHFCMAGEDAENLAVTTRNLEMVGQDYYYTRRRHDQLLLSKETDSIVNDHDLEQTKTKTKTTEKQSQSETETETETHTERQSQSQSQAQAQSEMQVKSQTQTQQDSAIAYNLLQNENKFGTVGCVCWYKGHVAAATSTGGMTNKLPGRVGDSAMIGCG